MKSSLEERFGRLGPVHVIEPVHNGSSVVVTIRRDGHSVAKTVDAVTALARRGVAMLRAKRAIEQSIAEGLVTLTMPSVEDERVLALELRDAGFSMATVVATHP